MMAMAMAAKFWNPLLLYIINTQARCGLLVWGDLEPQLLYCTWITRGTEAANTGALFSSQPARQLVWSPSRMAPSATRLAPQGKPSPRASTSSGVDSSFIVDTGGEQLTLATADGIWINSSSSDAHKGAEAGQQAGGQKERPQMQTQGKFAFLLSDASLSDTKLVLRRARSEGNTDQPSAIETEGQDCADDVLETSAVHACVMCANR